MPSISYENYKTISALGPTRIHSEFSPGDFNAMPEQNPFTFLRGGSSVLKIDTIIPRNETARLVSDFYIHVSVSGLYISTIGPSILLYCVCRPIVGIYIALRHMNE
jgi:hypothetical protein